MRFSREWFTPLTIGSATLLSVTGVLMFFHLDTGMNKLGHQWLSWLFLLAVTAYAASNGYAFKRYFTVRRAQFVLAGMLLLTVMTFLPGPDRKPNPQKMALKVLESADLSQVAALKGRTLEDMQTHLRRQGISVQDRDQSLQAISEETHTSIQTILMHVLSIQ